jgi:cation diffusion facilitator CzcD-associated flavoprotein CzcO
VAGSPSIAIVGAGFAGVGMAITLRRAGFEDLTVFERGPDVGGVWRENRYPGAAVDVPSDLYSYSFERRYPFARRFGEQAQLLEYVRHCARRHGVLPHVRLDCEVLRATYGDGRWHLELATGETAEADVLIPACGQLSQPSPPDIAGWGSFDGPAFHSAHWPEDLDVAGRRLAVIGTGATAVQIVPAVAGVAAQVDVYQRSAPWVIPKWDAEGLEERPVLVEYGGRLLNWLFFEALIPGFVGPPWAMAPIRAVAEVQRRVQVRDRELRRRVTPDYPMGCKRVLVTGDYYPALMRDDVDLITTPIETITPLGIRTSDGAERAYDAIACATGFATGDPIAPMEIVGADGRSLSRDAWAGGAEAYLGISVPGFPNMFLLYGPNTNLGSGSIVYMLEAQYRYVRDAVQRIRDRGLAWIDVREGPHRAFVEEMDRRLERSVWVRCDSWYRRRNGRVTNNWPGLMSEYRIRTRRLRPSHYRAAPRSATAPAPPRP